jgi:hypothetical protein
MTYSGQDEIKESINAFKDYIMKEVLAVSLEYSEDSSEELKINDYNMKVTIKQVKK